MSEGDMLKAGFVALIGAPNAGKSTLLNAMVGTKIAIVTHKVQTTRTRLLGIALEGMSQIIFVDTPGIFKPKRRLDRAMVSAAWKGAGDADETVLLIDAERGITGEVDSILNKLLKSKRQVILALNKIDLLKKEKLLKLVEELNGAGVFTKIFMISALKGSGVEDLKSFLGGAAPEGPWLYPEDQITDVTQRSLASEITREQIFLRLHQELPYEINVETIEWKDMDNGSIRIEQNIHVARDNHKGMVIGKGGQTLKKLGELARAEMKGAFGVNVHLFLFVKVSEAWDDNPFHYKDMGLDFVE